MVVLFEAYSVPAWQVVGVFLSLPVESLADQGYSLLLQPVYCLLLFMIVGILQCLFWPNLSTSGAELFTHLNNEYIVIHLSWSEISLFTFKTRF